LRSLADKIEQYIKSMLKEQQTATLELKRNDLAQVFQCVPSQINYVLGTRFTLEHGYLIESRRGGGGYIRITKISMGQDNELLRLIDQTANKLISQQAGEGLTDRLAEEGFLSSRETLLVKAMISRDALPVELPLRDMVRANIIRAVLLTLLRKEFNEEG